MTEKTLEELLEMMKETCKNNSYFSFQVFYSKKRNHWRVEFPNQVKTSFININLEKALIKAIEYQRDNLKVYPDLNKFAKIEKEYKND